MKAELKPVEYPCFEGAMQLDLTQGCDVGCIYCAISGSTEPEILDTTDLLSGPAPGMVYLSPNSDCMAVPEPTHRVLETFLPQGTCFAIITKKRIPEKTVELMSKYSGQVIPIVSLARMDMELNAYIEPNAATAQERLGNIRRLSDAGLKPMARLNPIYPIVDDTDENLREMVNAFAANGAHCVKAAYAVARDSRTPELKRIVERMEQHPQLRESWAAMSETIKIHRGKGDVPPYDLRAETYRKIKGLCDDHNLRFAQCSVLDYPIREKMPKGFPVCKSIMTFYGGLIDPR